MENKLQIVYKDVNDLLMYDNNPRKNSDAVQYVMNSIQQFGFKVPIVIDSNNMIVCGHTRYKAARRLRMAQVPCIVADDLTEEQIRVFRIADNKTGEMAGWDFDRLGIEMSMIDPVEFDLADFGFFPEYPKDEEEEEDDDDGDDDFDDREKEPKYYIQIECKSANDQRETYERLTKLGIECEMV